MSAIFPVALSAPARFVGTVDATRDRKTPTPRTLEQAFGPGTRNAVLIPLDAKTPMHPAERLVLRGSALAGLAVIVLLVVERLM